MTESIPAVLAQLAALRAQLDATIALTQAIASAVMPEPPMPPPPTCSHPHGRQRNASTFAEPGMVVCLDCGVKHPGSE